MWVASFTLDDAESHQEIGMFRRNSLTPHTESAWIPYDHEDWVPDE